MKMWAQRFILLTVVALLHTVTCEQWHFVTPEGAVEGPVDTDEIQGHFYSGDLTLESMIVMDGGSQWQPMSSFESLTQKFKEERPLDPRSNLLYDADYFNYLTNQVKMDMEQMSDEKVFCAKASAFRHMLRKDVLKKAITDQVPELKQISLLVQELHAQLAELKLDVQMSERDFNKTISQYEEGTRVAQKRLMQHAASIAEMRSEPMTLRFWDLLSETTVDVQGAFSQILDAWIVKPLTQVKGFYLAAGVLFVFFILSKLRK